MKLKFFYKSIFCFSKNFPKLTIFTILESFFFAFSVIFFTSCSQLAENSEDFLKNQETVEFSLPNWSNLQSEISEFPNLKYWNIEVFSAEKSEKFTVSCEVSSIKLSLPKNKTTSILAYPITIHNSAENDENSEEICAKFFYPAGAVYPQNSNNLEWSQGFAAWILKSIFSENFENRKNTSNFVDLFNWSKFIETLSEKEQNSVEKIDKKWAESQTEKSYPAFFNPWNLEKNSILSSIASKSFSTSKLSLPSTLTVTESNESFKNLNGTKNLLSAYIPENYIFRKVNFLSILKSAEVNGKFLLRGSKKLAIFSITSGGRVEISLCALPQIE